MGSRHLTIHVSPEDAHAYETASPEVQRQLDAVLGRKLREATRGLRPHGEASEAEAPPKLTGRALLDSGLVGMWKDRPEVEDSATFARRLRDKAQHR